jgi:hypothetical protein
VLRLAQVQDVPSAAVVHDVTDEVTEDLGVRAWHWRPKARRVTAGAAVGLSATAAVPAVEPPEHVRGRLRRIGDTVESVGVIVLFPLAVGVFGVYERLLGTF